MLPRRGLLLAERVKLIPKLLLGPHCTVTVCASTDEVEAAAYKEEAEGKLNERLLVCYQVMTHQNNIAIFIIFYKITHWVVSHIKKYCALQP